MTRSYTVFGKLELLSLSSKVIDQAKLVLHNHAELVLQRGKFGLQTRNTVHDNNI